jgi:hypothetical protein
MKNEFNMSSFTGSELTIREGKAIDLKEPRVTIVSGTIDSPLRWLKHKLTSFVIICCSVFVNKEIGTITLVTDEKNHYSDEITGRLEFHPDFVKFGINSGQQETSHDLAEKIKMWRSCFKDKDTAMKLVKNLRNFTAKVNKELEAFKDDRANYALKKSQIVETNLPETFILVVPVFKGQPKESLEVEINIDADKLTCSLISPQANDYIAEFKEKIIDEQIEKIREVAPELVIIEQ